MTAFSAQSGRQLSSREQSYVYTVRELLRLHQTGVSTYDHPEGREESTLQKIKRLPLPPNVYILPYKGRVEVQ